MNSRKKTARTWSQIASPAGIFGLFVAGVGCTRSESPPPIRTSALALEAFESCEDLEAYVEDQAVELMKSQLRRGGWGWRGGGPWLEGDVAATAGPPRSASDSAPTAYTKTNVQVEGVDEADFVKTNGTHIFVLTANRLYIAKSWPAADLGVLASVTLEGYPSNMFLDEPRNKVVVFSSVYAPYAVQPEGGDIACLAYGACGDWAVATKVTVIDVDQPNIPRVISQTYLPGWAYNSRKIDASIRVVLGDNLRWPSGLKWWPEFEHGLWENPARLEAAREALIPENERIIRAQSITHWLPYPVRRTETGTLLTVPYDCRDFNKTNASVDLGFTTVATLNLDTLDQVPSRTSILATAHEVYASHSSLYLATHHFWWWPEFGQEDFTYAFKFDITDPNHARFVAAGGIAGHIVNPFSLDEHNGALRVASTIARRVEDPQNPDNTWGIVETANRVSVLAERGGELSLVGQTPDLAIGERIQSARFLGDRAFVVTFRQVDPLFALDMRDPTNPRVVGELKVPGFSSYIHPLGSNHLLTIGIHMPDPNGGNVDWTERRMKLSLFDVSDLAHPAEAFTAIVGTAHGWSEAAWEHKAFNFFAERGLLAIPFSDYRPTRDGDYWGEFVSDLRVFHIDTAAGIRPEGAISMRDIYQTYAYQDWTWSWSPWIRRSVMADDYVYAISDAGIRVAHKDSLSQPIATATFDRVIRF